MKAIEKLKPIAYRLQTIGNTMTVICDRSLIQFACNRKVKE